MEIYHCHICSKKRLMRRSMIITEFGIFCSESCQSINKRERLKIYRTENIDKKYITPFADLDKSF